MVHCSMESTQATPHPSSYTDNIYTLCILLHITLIHVCTCNNVNVYNIVGVEDLSYIALVCLQYNPLNLFTE